MPSTWMQTFTGVRFTPLEPQVEDIDIRDIAHSLAYQCRYAGHTRKFLSIAEHCWHLSHLVSDKNKLIALLHDATEAYVADVPRPLKPFLPNYYEIEDKVYEAIAERYGLPVLIPDEVHEADTRILLDERNQFMTKSPSPIGDGWPDHMEPFGITIHGWPPSQAEDMFLRRFEELVKERCPYCGALEWEYVPVNSHYETTCCKNVGASCCEGPVSALP